MLRVKKNKGVVTKVVNDKWYILEKNQEYMRELSDVAGFIWASLDQPKSIDQIVDQVCQEYAVETLLARKDVEEFVKLSIHDGFMLKC